jgi:hypothetical protein
MTVPKWFMKGSLIAACSCDWGCPCNFDARPTKGFCEGGYTVAVREGRFGDTTLDGLKTVWLGHSPGPLHEGNVTSLIVIDEESSPEQREALLSLWKGGGVGQPFDIFASVTATWLDPVIAPIDVKLRGINSEVKVAGGKVWELAMSRIHNPVTGDEEEIYLDKPTGFTSLRSELGMSSIARLTANRLSFDHSGQYAEYAEFEYSGP